MTTSELVLLRKALPASEFESICKALEAGGIIDGQSATTLQVTQPYMGDSKCAVCGGEKIKTTPWQSGEALQYYCGRCGLVYKTI
jgi:hypothetical protein